jgi:hypothetical protein
MNRGWGTHHWLGGSRRCGPSVNRRLRFVLDQGDDWNGIRLFESFSRLLFVLEEEIEDVLRLVRVGTVWGRRGRSQTISTDWNATVPKIAELRLESPAQVLISEMIDRSIVQNKSVSHDETRMRNNQARRMSIHSSLTQDKRNDVSAM